MNSGEICDNEIVKLYHHHHNNSQTNPFLDKQSGAGGGGGGEKLKLDGRHQLMISEIADCLNLESTQAESLFKASGALEKSEKFFKSSQCLKLDFQVMMDPDENENALWLTFSKKNKVEVTPNNFLQELIVCKQSNAVKLDKSIKSDNESLKETILKSYFADSSKVNLMQKLKMFTRKIEGESGSRVNISIPPESENDIALAEKCISPITFFFLKVNIQLLFYFKHKLATLK